MLSNTTNKIEFNGNSAHFVCAQNIFDHKFLLLTQQQYSNLLVEHDQLKLKLTEYKTEAHYWKTQHEHAIAREIELKKTIELLMAKVRLREQQLFGRKTEQGKKHLEKAIDKQNSKIPSKRPRGHQKGAPGHGRSHHNHLPQEFETRDVPEKSKKCSICGLPYLELPGTADSEMISIIDVKAYKRIIRRKIYKQMCHCVEAPKIITAPAFPKLIPKGKYDVSIWAKILIEKYDYQRPLHRLLKCLNDQGIYLSSGTVTDGLKRILPLFVPIYNAIQKKCLSDQRWHADESRWQVFQETEGKVGYRWYLWVFKSVQAVIFKIAPSRSSEVVKLFFKHTKKGILNVDRYVAYKVIAKSGILILAFCWAHVRRDFLNHAKEYPKQERWALDWVDLIGELYHINHQRIQYSQKTSSFICLDQQLREKIQNMKFKYLSELENNLLHRQTQKLLKSLKTHWDGLTVFVEHPEIPMDNNAAERQLRNAIVGRKNYYGSGSIWSSELSAMLFSIFETLRIWKMNPKLWITDYLQACAEHCGKPIKDIQSFLPWSMSKKRKVKFLQHHQSWDTS